MHHHQRPSLLISIKRDSQRTRTPPPRRTRRERHRPPASCEARRWRAPPNTFPPSCLAKMRDLRNEFRVWSRSSYASWYVASKARAHGLGNPPDEQRSSCAQWRVFYYYSFSSVFSFCCFNFHSRLQGHTGSRHSARESSAIVRSGDIE